MARVGYLAVLVNEGLLQVLWSELNSGLNSNITFPKGLICNVLMYTGMLRNLPKYLRSKNFTTHSTGSGFPVLKFSELDLKNLQISSSFG